MPSDSDLSDDSLLGPASLWPKPAEGLVAQVVPETSLDRSFDYTVPDDMKSSVALGSKVRVSFGSRTLIGYVIGLSEKPSVDGENRLLKPIEAVLGSRSFIPPALIRLAHWMAQYYISPLGIVLQAILPQSVRGGKSGFKRRLWVELKSGVDAASVPALLKRSPAQESAWAFLISNGSGWLQDHVDASKIGAASWRGLAERNLIIIEPRDQERDPFALAESLTLSIPHTLSPEQASALQAIHEEETSPKPRVVLLHGVTGSGKTEVYLQAIAEAVRKGGTALILVPEIALTPQTVDRFRSRFIGEKAGVAVLHSHLSIGERHDQWQQIRSGRAKIVIGVRSAVFAPLENLRIIVVDEEHEPSYKQEDSPHYQARDVAIMRGRMEGAVVVLGSATPSLESFQHAMDGKYRMCRLLQRPEEVQLPRMHIVDLRTKPKLAKSDELLPRTGVIEKDTPRAIHDPALPAPGTLISPALEEALHKRLERHEQAIIFLNRRGYSSSIQCMPCGEIAMCTRCSVSLTFHRAAQRLRCHLCDYESAVPPACPACGHAPYKYSGTGTEKVEHVLRSLFPQANIGRMDADTMRQRGAYTHILREFADGKIDFLVGTQMIAKGLHFPNVTCVGVINSDMALLIPDFRSSERVFQLLMQVSGRSGRGQLPGEVFVQTRVPFHPAIQFARHNDYDGFAESELDHRQVAGYPPYSRCILITGRGRSEEKVTFVMEQITKELEELQLTQMDIAGPNPAPIAKIEDRYRYQIFLRTTRITAITPKLRPLFLGRTWLEDVQITVNVDPTDLL